MRSGEPPFDTPSGIPSDAGPPLDEHALEAELEAAEQEAAAAGRGRRNWSWVNRPITIWLLSTVAVSILSFAYTQYSTCRSSFATDSSRFARLAEELVFRIGAIYGAALSDSATAGIYLFGLDPDRQFLFTEFKGRLPNELAAEVKQLLGKWHPSDAAESKSKAVSTAPLDEAGLSTPRTIDTYVQQLLAGPGDIFDLLDAWIVIHRTLPLASNPESVAAVTGGRGPWEPERCPISTAIETSSDRHRSASSAHSGRSLETWHRLAARAAWLRNQIAAR